MYIAVIMSIIIIIWNDLNAHFYAFNQFQVSALFSVLSTLCNFNLSLWQLIHNHSQFMI